VDREPRPGDPQPLDLTFACARARFFGAPRVRSRRNVHSTPSVSQQSPFEAEIAALIAQAVNLPSPPDTIDPNDALFGAGLGLDSIDLLEIALAVTQRYGCELRSDDPDNARIFASLRNLAAHIAERRRS
jgi:acyl carrier protein